MVNITEAIQTNRSRQANNSGQTNNGRPTNNCRQTKNSRQTNNCSQTINSKLFGARLHLFKCVRVMMFAMAAVFICCFGTMRAQAADIQVRFGSNFYEKNQNERFPMGVYVENVDGTTEGIGSYHIEIAYDTTKLQYSDGASGIVGDGVIFIDGVGVTDGSQNKTMIYFNALQDGASSVSVIGAVVYDAAGNSLNVVSLGAVQVTVIAVPGADGIQDGDGANAGDGGAQDGDGGQNADGQVDAGQNVDETAVDEPIAGNPGDGDADSMTGDDGNGSIDSGASDGGNGGVVDDGSEAGSSDGDSGDDSSDDLIADAGTGINGANESSAENDDREGLDTPLGTNSSAADSDDANADVAQKNPIVKYIIIGVAVVIAIVILVIAIRTAILVFKHRQASTTGNKKVAEESHEWAFEFDTIDDDKLHEDSVEIRDSFEQLDIFEQLDNEIQFDTSDEFVDEEIDEESDEETDGETDDAEENGNFFF